MTVLSDTPSTIGAEDTLSLRVAEVTSVSTDVVALTLVDRDGGELPAWTPGAHLDLHVGPGLIRQYSLCSDPNDLSRYRIAVLRVANGRGGSIAVHERVAAGDTVTVSRPRNHFELADAESHLLIAGGIGITPVLPMAHRLAALGTPWRLLYGGRSRASMAFVDELPDGDVTLAPADECGRPDLAGFLAAWPNATVHACGPQGMLDAVRDLHAGPVRTERFTATAPAGSADDASFEAHLSTSDMTLTVPGDVTLLDAVRAAGVDVPSSCESGICGTCETRVLAGTPDHRDDLLTDDERAAGDTMLICVSRCLGDRLVLDL